MLNHQRVYQWYTRQDGNLQREKTVLALYFQRNPLVAVPIRFLIPVIVFCYSAGLTNPSRIAGNAILLLAISVDPLVI